jgi:UDP-N-acetylmuramoyl-tripeptide--D-alanyl-D-alanine ligase
LNAVAAFAVAQRMGFEADEIAAALASFQPGRMRLNVIRCGAVTVINDSYNANPSSTAAAIDVLAGAGPGRRVLVVGDMLELGSAAQSWHERTGCRAAQAGIDLLVAVGSNAPAVAAGARTAGSPIDTLVYQDADRAGAAAGEWLQPGDVVLVKGSRAVGMERVVEAIGQSARAAAPVT